MLDRAVGMDDADLIDYLIERIVGILHRAAGENSIIPEPLNLPHTSILIS